MVVAMFIGTCRATSAQPPAYSNTVRTESSTRYWMPGVLLPATSASKYDCTRCVRSGTRSFIVGPQALRAKQMILRQRIGCQEDVRRRHGLRLLTHRRARPSARYHPRSGDPSSRLGRIHPFDAGMSAEEPHLGP